MNMKKKISNEMIREAVKKLTKNGFGFFRTKGFRLYDEKVGIWTLLFLEKAEKLVCDSITADLILSGIDKLNQKSAWTLFLDWFSVAYC